MLFFIHKSLLSEIILTPEFKPLDVKITRELESSYRLNRKVHTELIGKFKLATLIRKFIWTFIIQRREDVTSMYW